MFALRDSLHKPLHLREQNTTSFQFFSHFLRQRNVRPQYLQSFSFNIVHSQGKVQHGTVSKRQFVMLIIAYACHAKNGAVLPEYLLYKALAGCGWTGLMPQSRLAYFSY